MSPEDREPAAAVVAVPEDAAEELAAAGLVRAIPTIRGPVLEAAVVVGSNAASLVTLLQAPDAIRAFAAWVVSWARRRTDTIEISGRNAGRRVELRVDGDVPVEAVAEFLVAALGRSSADTPPS